MHCEVESAPTVLTLRWRQPLTKPKVKRPRKRYSKVANKDPSLRGKTTNDAYDDEVDLGTPAPIITTCQKTYRTAQWWFSMPEQDTTKYRAAYRHWVDAGWEIVRRSSTFYECVSLYTTRKAADLLGRTNAYVAQKGQLIQHINSHISDCSESKPPETLTLVAIGILAYCSLLDRDFGAARTHMAALQAFEVSRRFENAKEEWLYVLWVDLRYSLIHGTTPLLDYCVPKAYRESLSLDMSHLWSRATAAMKASPVSLHAKVLSDVDIFDLWIRVLQLCELRKGWQYQDVPPFGLLYDVEYRLRVLHSRVLKMRHSIFEKEQDNAACLQLLLAALQVTTWVFTRFWAPASPGSRRVLVTQAQSLVRVYSATDLRAVWDRNSGKRSTLQWVVATITAFAAQDGVAPEAVSMEIMRELFTDRETFIRELQQWPWSEDWHAESFDALWERIEDVNDSNLPSVIAPKSSKHFYLGAVEFYQN